MASLMATLGAPSNDPTEDEDHENIPPAADPSPAPPSETNQNAADERVVPLYRDLTDKCRNAMAPFGQSPVRSPDIMDEMPPNFSMLDSTVETSYLSVAITTSPAAASHSATPRYSREAKSGLTPVFKCFILPGNNSRKWPTPGQAQHRRTAGHDVPLLNPEFFTTELGGSLGRSPFFWLQDETLPEVSLLDSTMESSNLSTSRASPSFMPPVPEQHLAGTPEAGEEAVSDAGSMLSVITAKSRVLTGKQSGGDGDIMAHGAHHTTGAEVVQSSLETCPCLQSDVLPDGGAALGSPSRCSASPSPNRTMLVTAVDLPVQLNTTQVLPGNVTFISPPGDAQMNSNVTMETTGSSGAKCEQSFPLNRTLASEPVSVRAGAVVSLACSAVKLQDTFEIISSPTPSAQGCSQDNQGGGQDNQGGGQDNQGGGQDNQGGGQDNQGGGQDNQGGGQDNQSGGHDNQSGSRGNWSTEDSQNVEAQPPALSAAPHDGANNTLLVGVDLRGQSEVNTPQVVSGAAAEAASSAMLITSQDDARPPSPVVTANITMEMGRWDSKSDESSLRNQMLDCTPIYRPSAGLDLNNTFESASSPTPSALTCQATQTAVPLTSTPMPDSPLYTPWSRTLGGQKRRYSDGPSKLLPQTSSPAANTAPAVRSFLPHLRPIRPISHALRDNPSCSDAGRPAPHCLAAPWKRVQAPPPKQSKPKNTNTPSTTRIPSKPSTTSVRPALPGLKQPSGVFNKPAPTGIPSTNRKSLLVLRPPSARLATTASSNDKPGAASSNDKPGAASSNDKPGAASAANPRQLQSQAKRSLQPKGEALLLAKRGRTAGCPNCALLRQELEKKDAELRRLQKDTASS
ncbi:unnamed protein product [Lota lota]